ncbi:MAG TPA: IPT/TIG domain-containing protein, partial [Acidimicrobiales bacterium]|nr:IPT/TIG domain-containing protein [Acidimicrobiales bacterium]
PSVSAIGPSGGPTAGGNTVDVFGSGFGAGGPIGSVTFGRVRAKSVKYITNYEIQVVVPAETKATSCTTGKGFDPANTCQVQVVVNGAHGTSSTSSILAPYTGNMTANDEGIVVPTPGTEVDPAPSEYDYAPLATITSITPNPYSEATGKPITINGTGFNVLTLDWVNIGVPTEWNNGYSAFDSVTDDHIVVMPFLPAGGTKPKPVPGGVTVLGLGGLSKAAAFSYTK